MVPSSPPVSGLPSRHGGEKVERVIVAVKAEKVISKSGLAWALTHVARPGDCITLLAISSEKPPVRRRFLGFPRLKGDCRSGDPTKLPDRVSEISESCSQMVLQVQNQIQVKVRIKVISVTSAGAVAAESKSSGANWVILDKKLKRELKHCMDELRCNIVVMKGSHAKVLRLNLSISNDLQTPFYSSSSSSPIKDIENLHSYNMKHTTPASSPECQNTSYTKTSGEISLSSPDTAASFFFVYKQNPLYEGQNKVKRPPYRQNSAGGGDYLFDSSIRDAVALSKNSSIPPPLCSLCQFKAPAFGKPPKQFCYEELVEATDDFSDTKFVSEGGFGLVHRGVMRNGLIIAVKQLKLVGPQRDADFCREVRVLSCAQHRNVVLLIGFCIEGKKRLLVYEYICNGSLDFHLHGNEMSILDWQARLKIAIGAAKGLRYLHEDCRVGCIIHRNLRPDNILLTHDFEPLVADFGLARLHNELKSYDRNQVVGTSGYLAPEYINDGKMDRESPILYAFGLVLLEAHHWPESS
ncbi:proline-rich receptor-like protein kinase perk9 [Phtheirospermum japonicum]|uniref:non-specific serine/threonine protein kinase n=1 Tax=Phtheirospermum japonicum TaxID=374723 RepID=A0A830CUT9_9LAMI|nr:proline-rich receptor-like protein kinase perk9 [Phtheirospermum japonicum]